MPDDTQGATPTGAPTGEPPTLGGPEPTARRPRAKRSPASGPAPSADPGAGAPGASGEDEEQDKQAPKPRPRRPGIKTDKTHLNPVLTFADSAAGWPTPGGIALMFVFIILFLFLIVPVNGKRTRARLIWDTLRGLVKLPGVTYTTASGASATADTTQAADTAQASSAAHAASSASFAPSPGGGSGVSMLAWGADLGGAGEVGGLDPDELAVATGFSGLDAFDLFN